MLSQTLLIEGGTCASSEILGKHSVGICSHHWPWEQALSVTLSAAAASKSDPAEKPHLGRIETCDPLRATHDR